MKLIHIELADANAFIANMHRHHKPIVGHRWSIGVEQAGELVGVATIGRAVARMTPQNGKHAVAEVTRLATNGHKNACSFLYAAAARGAEALGYTKIQTFILASETGVSLKASGWTNDGPSAGGDWNRPSRGGRRMDQPQEPKIKWSKALTP